MATAGDFCTKDTWIRSTYYSDVYRAEFTLGGLRQQWDVEHIGIPFSPEKEICLKTRFGIPDDQLETYYAGLSRNIRNHADMLRTLKEAGDPGLDRSTRYPEKSSLFRRENGGSDVYLISAPAEVLTSSAVIRDNASTLHNILNLGIRLLQILKRYNDRGFCVGTLDLDSFTADVTGGRLIIQDCFFYFAAGSGRNSPVLTPDAGVFLPAAVMDGTKPLSPDTDLYALCSLLWSMLDGRHYTESPDLSRRPKYAPPDLADALSAALRGGTAERQKLNRSLREALKTARNGIIRFEEPAWTAEQKNALEEFRRYQTKVSEEEDEEEEEDDDDEPEELEDSPEIFFDRMTLVQKVLTFLAVTAAAGTVLVFSLLCGKAAGEQTVPAAAQPPPETGTEEPAREPAPETPDPVPLPVQTMTPVRQSEYPLLELDPDYDWFRSEYPSEDFCAVVFQDHYEHRTELIEKWNFRLGDDSIQCFVYARPEYKTEIACSPDGGDKVLVIAGNGSGRIRVNRTQSELAEYMRYRFTYGVLNGLPVLMSTGSTPFTVPTPVPSPEEEEAPPVSGEEIPDTGPPGSGYGTVPAAETETNASRIPDFGGYASAGTSEVIVPDWDSTDWTDTGVWDEGPDGTGSGTDSSYSVITHTFYLEAKNVNCSIGSETGVRLTGDVSGPVRVWSSDPALAEVSEYPDSSGYYRVRCVGRGSAEIFGSCDWGTARLTIDIN